ncbi:MAG: hypothetical protein OYI31_00250 [Chloroflexota bacterium]|nr:hypothetical protein [Chloroflexota bacterium]
MANRRPRPLRLTAGVFAVAIAACQDEPLFVSAPPAGDPEWVYKAPYEGEFRAEDLEIVALVQLTESGSPAHLVDASFKGELTVSPYPAFDPTVGDFQTTCGLWIIGAEAGSVRKVSDGLLGYPWGALFSPDGERMAYAATNECLSTLDHDTNADIRLLHLDSEERTTLYEGERAPILRGWAAPDAILAMRNVPDLGWTYRTIGVKPLSEMVSDLVIEYEGFKLFTDRPSPRGNWVLLVVEQPATASSWNAEFSLVSLITTEPIGEPWEAWYTPDTAGLWSPDNRLLLYLVAGKIRDGLPVDVMTLDPETGEHTPILTGLDTQTDAFLPQTWSPKSEAVLLLADDGTSLHAVNADGSGYGEVAGSVLGGALPTYRNVRWPAGGGYLFFERHGPKPERGVMVTSVESEIWAAVVHLPGESGGALEERVRQLESGPWPVSLGQ